MEKIDVEKQILINEKIQQATGISDEELYELEEPFMDEFEETPHILVIDWREEDENIIDYANALLEHLGHPLIQSEWMEHEDENGTDLLLSYRDKNTRISMKYSDAAALRYIALRAINSIWSMDIELKALRSSILDDTHIFLANKKSWWEILEKKKSKEAELLFVPLSEPINFF